MGAWREVTSGAPCPSCGHDHWCARVDDDLHCMRTGEVKTPEGYAKLPSDQTDRVIFRLKNSNGRNGSGGAGKRVKVGNKRVHARLDLALRAAAFGIEARQRQNGEPVGAKYVKHWVYLDREDNEIFRDCRFTTPTGKAIRPLHSTAMGWVVGKPKGLLPVLGMNDVLLADPNTRVFIVEGEKAFDAANRIGLLVVTSGGSSSANRADWSFLAGRDTAIIPDNDEPGWKYAKAVGRKLLTLHPAAKVKVLQPLGETAGYDIADFCGDASEGTDVAAIIEEMVEKAPSVTGTTTKVTNAGEAKRKDAPANRTNRNGHIARGNRNNALMSRGVGMRRDGVSDDVILANLLDHNRERCDPRLPDNEVRQIAQSVCKYDTANQLTELGNADRFVEAYRHCVKWCDQLGGWIVYDGRLWERDAVRAVEGMGTQTVRKLFDEAARAEADRSADIAKHAIRSQKAGAIAGMLRLSRPRLAIVSDRFDTDQWELNLGNGTLDLRSGRLRPHNADDLITRILRSQYDPDAACPRWLQFLNEIFDNDHELIQFLQRAVGYSLTGDVSEQCLFILHGTGANGKSTFIQTLTDLLGDYSLTAPASTFMVKRGDAIPNDVARLRGSRFVATIETDSGRRLAEPLIKQMTGGDRMTARFLHGEFFEFQPTHKIWVVTNDRPEIRGSGHAIWRRVRLVPFNVTIADKQQDKQLYKTLVQEFPGILAWAVQGCISWQQDGLGIPGAVVAATTDYRASMDHLARFVEERCTVAVGERTSAHELHKAFVDWSDVRIGIGKFGQSMREHGYTISGRSTGGKRFWEGLKLHEL